MITIKAILNEENILTPETEAPQTDFGNHCDGINFYYFESEEEAKEFYAKQN